MDSFLTTAVCALAIHGFIHIIIEIWSVNWKVRRLQGFMDKKPLKELPVNINTRAKAYAISIFGFFAFTVPIFLVLVWLDLSNRLMLQISIGFMLAIFVAIAIGLDQYHIKIEKVTNKFKKS